MANNAANIEETILKFLKEKEMKKNVKYVGLALAVFGLLSLLSTAALAETQPVKQQSQEVKSEEHHAGMMKQIEDMHSQMKQDNTEVNRPEVEVSQSSEWKPLFPHLTTKYGY